MEDGKEIKEDGIREMKEGKKMEKKIYMEEELRKEEDKKKIVMMGY